MTDYIYLVKGSTGVYDNFETWDVKAFIDEQQAKDYTDACQDEIKSRKGKRRLVYAHYDDSILDPSMHIFGYSTDYEVVKVELVITPPSKEE